MSSQFSFQDNICWKDLETKGYLILKGVLDEKDLEPLCKEAETAVLASKSYRPCLIGDQNIERLKNKFVLNLFSELKQKTKLQADHLQAGYYMGKKNGAHFNWHTDYADFYICQDFYNYINVYIPIIKPIYEKTNLMLLPFDIFDQYAPDLVRHFKGRGASQIIEANGISTFFDSNDGSSFTLDYLVSEFSITPFLSAGDVLLVRADVFHKSQDADTFRIAASLRLFNSGSVVHKTDLYADNIYKAQGFAVLGQELYVRRRAFTDSKKDKMSFGEMEEKIKEISLAAEFKLPFDAEKAKLTEIIQSIADQPNAKFFILKGVKSAFEIQPYADASNALERSFLFVEQAPGTNVFIGLKTSDRPLGMAGIRNTQRALELIKSAGIEIVKLPPQSCFNPASVKSSTGNRVAYFVDFESSTQLKEPPLNPQFKQNK